MSEKLPAEVAGRVALAILAAKIERAARDARGPNRTGTVKPDDCADARRYFASRDWEQDAALFGMPPETLPKILRGKNGNDG